MADRMLRVLLFFISYVPLYVILALRTLPDLHVGRCALRSHDYGVLVTPGIFVGCAIIGVGVAGALLRHASALSGVKVRFTNPRDRGREAAAYLSSYILPFVMFNERSWQVWAAFAVYLLVLAIVTVSSDLVLTNPTLYLFRRRIVEADVRRSRGPGDDYTVSALLICKAGTRFDADIDVIEFAGGYLEKGR